MEDSEHGEPVAALTRSEKGRWVAGVCGGLARRTDIDPVIYRVMFGVLGCFGAGVLLYGAAWLLLPPEGEETTRVDRLLGRKIDGPSALAALAGLFIMGGLFIPSMAFPPMNSRPVTTALVVIGCLAALIAHRRGVDLPGLARALPGRLFSPPKLADAEPGAGSPPPGRTGDSPPPTQPPDRSASPEQRDSAPPPGGPAPGIAGQAGPATATDAPEPATRAPGGYTVPLDRLPQHPYSPPPDDVPTASYPVHGPPAPSRHREHGESGKHGEHGEYEDRARQRRVEPWLTLLVLAATATVAATLGLLALFGLLRVDVQLTLAAVVTTIGLGTVVGARYGRGRPLVVFGLVAALLLLAWSAMQPLQGLPLQRGAGEVMWRPTVTTTHRVPEGPSAGPASITPYRFGFGEVQVSRVAS